MTIIRQKEICHKLKAKGENPNINGRKTAKNRARSWWASMERGECVRVEVDAIFAKDAFSGK